MSLITSNHFRAIVGPDKSGMSLVRYLVRRSLPFVAVDIRENLPKLATLRTQYSQVGVYCGEFDAGFLCSAREFYVSPGLSPHTPALIQVAAKGVYAFSDIDSFIRETKVSIAAITDSNTKSAVIILVGEMAVAADKRAVVGDNLGTPALDLPADDIGLYVLELPSFQLETCDCLNAEVATVLNVSEDHMDRYGGMADYHLAKHRIFRGARQVVVNRADALIRPSIAGSVPCWSFDLNKPDLRAFDLIEEDDQKWSAFQFDKLLSADELKTRGTYSYSDTFAALAPGHVVGPSFDVMLGALKTFSGLVHRCRWVCKRQGVSYHGDSKATDVGAALAAIEGLSVDIDGKLMLFVGGDGRGAGFHGPCRPVTHFYWAVVLLGHDAGLIARALGNAASLVRVATLDEAVRQAAELAREGDTALLSPACASLGMFKSFEKRGRLFVRTIEELVWCCRYRTPSRRCC